MGVRETAAELGDSRPTAARGMQCECRSIEMERPGTSKRDQETAHGYEPIPDCLSGHRIGSPKKSHGASSRLAMKNDRTFGNSDSFLRLLLKCVPTSFCGSTARAGSTVWIEISQTVELGDSCVEQSA
eukprot:CAMPEP_0117680014 /NCGR_PEP_ID=MMETSP0804-20121206/18112_1 /TAXON_ID=1074897 /ORGANISM="Tetraselmis astigmatica, Strain CCMP880" /LENGTH=127 /DNA_ID=CAMNT_0005489455 /DNA_START=168 /DNA_END=552 /DNA_ORIENTATION=+